MRKLFDAKDIHHSEHLTELFLAVPEPSLVEKMDVFWNHQDRCCCRLCVAFSCTYKTWHMNDPPLSFAPRSCNIFQCCSLLSFPSPWITSRVTSCKTWENEGASESSASANTTATYRLNVLLFGAVIRSHKLCLAESTLCLHAQFVHV